MFKTGSEASHKASQGASMDFLVHFLLLTAPAVQHSAMQTQHTIPSVAVHVSESLLFLNYSKDNFVPICHYNFV